jgi:hypothetical protein
MKKEIILPSNVFEFKVNEEVKYNNIKGTVKARSFIDGLVNNEEQLTIVYIVEFPPLKEGEQAQNIQFINNSTDLNKLNINQLSKWN